MKRIDLNGADGFGSFAEALQPENVSDTTVVVWSEKKIVAATIVLKCCRSKNEALNRLFEVLKEKNKTDIIEERFDTNEISAHLSVFFI